MNKSVSQYVLNPWLFFLIINGKIICWNYETHEQYELETPYFERLLEYANKTITNNNKIDQELIDGRLIILQNSLVDLGEWEYLSRIFHFGSQIPIGAIASEFIENPKEFCRNYLNESEELLSSAPSHFTLRDGKHIQLPDPDYTFLKETNFHKLLSTRMTCRSFSGAVIPLKAVSVLLKLSFGIIRSDEEHYNSYGFKQIGVRKSSPSGGGLHSTEAYLLAINVEGLDKGVYHYQSHSHSLTFVNEFDTEIFPELLCGQYYAKNLSLGVFLTFRFDKLWHKYPNARAYRVALLDVGHLSQTFQLCTTGLGYNPWLTGAFIDQNVLQILKIDNNSFEQPLLFVGAGTGARIPLDPTMIQIADQTSNDADC